MELSKPFLWHHMKNIKKLNIATSGEERIITESANEETNSKTIELVLL